MREGVFISYAHDDDPEWITSVLRYFALLQRKGVPIWTDKQIKPGELWHDKIQDALAKSKVAVLLVSANFLSSPYIANNELPYLLDAAATQGMQIFWIPMEPSSYKLSEIAKYQAAHPPDLPISSLKGDKRKQAFVDITTKLAVTLGIS